MLNRVKTFVNSYFLPIFAKDYLEIMSYVQKKEEE